MSSAAFKQIISALTLLSACSSAAAESFSWPIGCVPGINCSGWQFRIGYPDIERAGRSSKCGPPGYPGHLGTDIVVSAVDQMVPVLAAADGIVRWVEDGKFDRCPNDSQGDCDDRTRSRLPLSDGETASLGFNAGNYAVIEHIRPDGRFLTLYAHLRSGSLSVLPGALVVRGQQIATVGSSGNSQVPHLHFGVYRQSGSSYTPIDPWRGPCNTAQPDGLWESEPPYQKLYARIKSHSGANAP